MFNYILMGSPSGGSQLVSVLIENSALGCDGSQGEAKVSWVTLGSQAGVTLNVDYNFDGGTNYNPLDNNIPASAGYQFENVSSEPGFVDLDSTYFKVSAYKGGVEIPGSPIYVNPTYPCL